MKNNENEVEEIEDWRDEHGRPSFEYLQSLAEEGTIESLNKLRSLAEDLDVNFSSNTLIEELVDMIRASVRKNGDSNPIR